MKMRVGRILWGVEWPPVEIVDGAGVHICWAHVMGIRPATGAPVIIQERDEMLDGEVAGVGILRRGDLVTMDEEGVGVLRPFYLGVYPEEGA